MVLVDPILGARTVARPGVAPASARMSAAEVQELKMTCEEQAEEIAAKRGPKRGLIGSKIRQNKQNACLFSLCPFGHLLFLGGFNYSKNG